MASNIYIYDRFGVKLGEFTQDVQREWLLNEPGEAEFSISAIEEIERLGGKDLGELIEFGNLVYVPNEQIGDWTGVIVRRTWRKGIIRIKALGAEKILAFSTPEAESKITGPAGSIFLKMLEVVNRQLDTKVVPGEVFTGGTSREETLEGIDILSEATRVAERANHDFDVTGVIANSRLELRGNWYEKKGVKTTLLLAEGRNLVDPDGDLLTEDGEEIANRIIGFPNSGTAASSKPVILSDDASAQQHGPRYFGEAYSDVSEQDTLLKHCQELLKKKKSPNRLIGCTVLDQGATFEQIRVGNQSLVELYTAGLTAGKLGTSLMGRTLGRRYTDRTKRYELALEEVLE